jgi:large subunit ribosomal protein L11
MIKKDDPCWENVSLQDICKSIIGTAHSCGIEVVRNLDAAEYGPYLEERRKIVERQETELQEAKAAKLLRVASAV